MLSRPARGAGPAPACAVGRACDRRNPAAMLPKNSPLAPSNWVPQGFRCMAAVRGTVPSQVIQVPVMLRAPGTISITNAVLLNATTTSLLCSPARSGPWEAGEPGETHGAPRQPGVKRSPRPSTSPGRCCSAAAPTGLLRGTRPTRPAGQERGFVLQTQRRASVLLSRTEWEPGGCWRSLAASLVLAESTPPTPSKFMDARLQMTSGSANPCPSPQSGSDSVLSPPGADALSHLPDCKTRAKQAAVCLALTPGLQGWICRG